MNWQVPACKRPLLCDGIPRAAKILPLSASSFCVHSSPNTMAGQMLAVLAAICMLAVSAQMQPAPGLTTTYTTPLTPAANDSITFQRSARATLLNILQVEIHLGPCAVRLPHFHSVDELILVGNNTLGFINVEPNNTVTDRQVPPGYIIEQPRSQLHTVYNPTCNTTYYVNIFNGLALNTYNVPYALQAFGNFSLDATYSMDGLPGLRFPGTAPTGQWVYNPYCLEACGIALPPNLVDVDSSA